MKGVAFMIQNRKIEPKDFEKIKFLKREDLNQLSFVELCCYMQTLNVLEKEMKNRE